MAVFITSFKEAFKKTLANWRYLPLIALFDALFFLLLGLGSFIFKTLSSSHLNTLIESGGKLTMDITSAVSEGGSALSVLMADPAASASITALSGAALLLAVMFYINFTLFSGTAWFYSSRILNEKIKFSDYMKKFSLISLFWGIIFAVVLSFYIKFILFALLRPEQILSSKILGVISNIILAIISYFALISLSIASADFKNNFKSNIMKTFKLGFFKAPVLIAAFAISAFLIYLNFFVTFALLQSFTATITAAYVVAFVRFIIAAPFLAFARVYLIETVKKIQ